jgi:lipopolysaccharide assembly outer membrane protein LptD (OstA)
LKLILYIQIIIWFIPGGIFSQVPDTTRLDDTLLVQPFEQIDTSRQIVTDIDAVIDYKAKDSIIYDVKNKKVYLYNEAEVTYKDLKLNAGIIVLDQETLIMEAFGLTNAEGRVTQMPIMFQGSERYESERLTYNFRSQRGTVSRGYTEADVGYYFGEKIKRVSPDILFVQNGLYTTSEDRIDPEYYFLSPKMKIVPGQRVIAQSVFLYIEGVPVLWIPFGIFPNKTGRASGLIPPTFGDDATYGKYINKLGYFFAISDYMDLALMGTWFSKGRIEGSTRFRYAFKYKFSGNIEGGYTRIRQGDEGDPNRARSDAWLLRVNHNQQFDPTTRIDANLSFISGKNYYDNTTNNLPELLRQNVLSNFTVSKRWEGKPYALSLNYYRDQNLVNGDIIERLPNVNFSISQTFPFESQTTSSFDKKFYEYFSYSYAGSFSHNRQKRNFEIQNQPDSVFSDSRMGAVHNLNLSLNPKFDFITVSPFVNYTELWYNKYTLKRFDPEDSIIISEDVSGIKGARYFNTGLSFATRLIGIFTPRIFNVTGIRHTITPTITYRFRPDFSADFWGYYRTFHDAAGNEIKYSIFEKEIYGTPPIGEDQEIIFNVGNLLEMKTQVNDTTENKFQLLNFNSGISYNLARDSLKFSELSTTFTTQIGSIFNIGGGARFNLYKFDETANTRVNKFLIDTDGKLADLTSFNINVSSSFSFNIGGSREFSDRDTTLIRDTVNVPQVEKEDYKDDRISKKEEVTFDIPLSGGFNYNYSEFRADPRNVTRSSNLSGNLAFSLTQNWRFTFAASYDLVNKRIAAPYVTAYRDLKSWELNFNWYPLGSYRGFSLEIRIKAPQLRDIKITKQANPRGVFN